MDEDDLPRPAASRLPARNLEPLGVAELEAYIAELRGEIARAEAAIKARQSHRAGIESLFRK
jgi:uncharacterized small protein (DUF1192 family)